MDVSIIIPTYNRLWSLPRAIDSCKNTNCSVEIIVVDDGSTDGTWEWLQQQSSVKSFYQKNQGQTYAINHGAMSATGKYIRFLDSDDFLTEGIIDKQFLVAEAQQADLVYSGIDIYNEATKTITKCPELRPWDDFLEVQLGTGYGSHFLAMLFKTDWVKKVPRRPDFAFREDRMFLLEYGLLEPKIAMVEGCGGYWVKHSEQMQANYRGWKSQVTNWQHFHIYKKILAQLADQRKLTQPRKNAAANSLWTLCKWIAKDSATEAAAIFNWILELNPDFKFEEKGMIGILYKTTGVNSTHKILRVLRFLKHAK
jgi:glycosyltransferase involved in cell wall biosynthesis